MLRWNSVELGKIVLTIWCMQVKVTVKKIENNVLIIYIYGRQVANQIIRNVIKNSNYNTDQIKYALCI